MQAYRSVPQPDGSVALEVPDGTKITSQEYTPRGRCRFCLAERMPDLKGLHVCARCRREPILRPKAKPGARPRI